MSLKKGENQKAIDRAVDACDRQFKPGTHDLFAWQDCVQGINIMRRIVRRKVSVKSAERAAKKMCLTENDYPGPRSRCQGGVRKLVVELKRRR